MAEQIYHKTTPSPKVLIIWIFSKSLIIWLIAFFFYQWLYIFLALQKNLLAFFVILFSSIIGLIVICFIWSTYLRKTYHYKITDRGVYFVGGIIVKKQKFIPFYKITNVIISQNILERALGINKLGIQTAGKGGNVRPEIVFEGLINPEKPYNLLKTLTEKVQKTPHKKYYSE